MVTLHFNGDLISGADMKRRAADRKVILSQEKRCCYGRRRIECDTCRKYSKDIKECTMSGNLLCPLYKLRVEAGNRLKTFKISSSDYRKMSSGAHWLIKTNKSKAVFFTLTFPPTIKKHKFTKSFYLNEISNVYFSRFIENLKKTYKCTGYIAVKENGFKHDRCHFHVLAVFPYCDLRIISDYWCRVISDICHYSNNALQTDKTSRIIRGDISRAIRYICKYFSKAKRNNGHSYTRLIFVSNNLLNKKIGLYDVTAKDMLIGCKGIYIQKLDYVTIFRITDKVTYDIFREDILYQIFDTLIKQEIDRISQKKHRKTQ